MKIFLTGATGFVGKHMLERLLMEGHAVRAAVRSLPGQKAQLLFHTQHPGRKDDFQWIPGDIVEGTGLDEVWSALLERRLGLVESGVLAARRREQRVRWMWALVEQRVRSALEAHDGIHGLLGEVTRSVADGATPPSVAAERLLRAVGLG